MTGTAGGHTAFPAEVHLSGLGITLREWHDSDIPAMAHLFDDPQVDRWTPLRAPFDGAAARAYLGQARQRRADGQRMQLAITTDGAAPLGEILLFRTGTVGEAELAYAIGASHRRQRLASRAVRLMISYACDALALTRLLLRIAEDNLASAAVAGRCGFRLTDAAPLARQAAQDPLLTWRHTLRPSPRDAVRVAIKHTEHR
ncbi:GNAT family N-acetyltransferase [Nonomuraea sp. NPDC050691]|uniref:GNAT family N-acetyltransferase n=1 Tax=Nonomuraea sp. NPDC050691 TaxID=3155661 RepID=UPI0033C71B33